MRGRCLECDAAPYGSHHKDCSEAQPASPPLGPDLAMKPFYDVRRFSATSANYLAQARAAARDMDDILERARAAGHTVIGDTIIVGDLNEGTV